MIKDIFLAKNFAQRMVTRLARRPEIKMTKVRIKIISGVKVIRSLTEAAIPVLALPME